MRRKGTIANLDIGLQPGLADPKSRIYLHCLDIYHYGRAVASNRASVKDVATEGRRAFRLAVLAADRVFLPASSYFEGKLAQAILAEHPELSRLGMVCLSAGEASIEEHREGKLPQYPNGVPGTEDGAYRVMPAVSPPAYLQKPGSSREKIEVRWAELVDTGHVQPYLARMGGRARRGDPERAWAEVPDLLGDRAFVPAHAHELLGKRGVKLPEVAVSRVVEPAYIDGYADSLGALIVGDLVYLASPFELAAQAAFSYRRVVRALAALGLLPVVDHANVTELLRLKSSPEWQALWPTLRDAGSLDRQKHRLAERARETTEGTHRFPRMGRTDCHLGIVTALPEEFVAMKQMLDRVVGTTKPPNDPNEYVVGEIDARSGGERIGSHRIALTLLKKTGTESAATATTNLFRSFPTVRLVLMVGIACGVPDPSDPDKHVRLGDIIVSDRQGIVDPTSGAVRDSGFEHRELLPPPSAALLQAVNALEADQLEREARPWEDRLDALIASNASFKRPAPQTDVLSGPDLKKISHPRDKRRRGRARHPLVFRGPIGSSNLLSASADFRDELARRHGLRGIEMEGSGIANATWDRSQSYGVIRASCDYGDSTKADQWHNYAAAAAAAYAACVIERIPPENGVDFLSEVSATKR